MSISAIYLLNSQQATVSESKDNQPGAINSRKVTPLLLNSNEKVGITVNITCRSVTELIIVLAIDAFKILLPLALAIGVGTVVGTFTGIIAFNPFFGTGVGIVTTLCMLRAFSYYCNSDR